MKSSNFGPGLYLVATPIGNMQDISARAIDAFIKSDVIACEDTRETKKLLQLLDVDYKEKVFLPIHEHNEFEDSKKVIEFIKDGKVVVYCSDAGMPAISDPGAILVDFLHQNDIKVSSVPGASALTTAYALSGFKSTSFSFIGFLPKTKQAKIDVINSFRNNSVPVIFYESPKRIADTIELLSEAIPDRDVLIARELTKKFEEVRRAKAQDLEKHFYGDVKGEIVVVVGAAQIQVDFSKRDSIIEKINIMKSKGLSSRDTIEILHDLTDLAKNEIKKIYQDIKTIKGDEK